MANYSSINSEYVGSEIMSVPLHMVYIASCVFPFFVTCVCILLCSELTFHSACCTNVTGECCNLFRTCKLSHGAVLKVRVSCTLILDVLFSNLQNVSTCFHSFNRFMVNLIYLPHKQLMMYLSRVPTYFFPLIDYIRGSRNF